MVFIDPLLPEDESVVEWLDAHARGRTVDVLITIYWHLRSATLIRDRYRATVWGNARTRDGVEELVSGLVEDGFVLPGGVVPFTPIPNLFSDEIETAYWLPRQRALAVGDILVLTPEGLRIWGEQKTNEQRAALEELVRPALRRFLSLPTELILAPHGGPLSTGAHDALAEALSAPTWQRP